MPMSAPETLVTARTAESEEVDQHPSSEVNPCDEAKAAPTRCAVTLKIKYVTNPGEYLLVCGSISELGNWDVSHAKRMRWSDGHVWTAELSVNSDSEFEYKYVACVGQPPSHRWEQGYNRKVVPAGKTELSFQDVWESVRVRFSIYYPVKPNHNMYIAGAPPEIGKWFSPGPKRMYLGGERVLPTGEKGRCWELEVVLARAEWGAFEYRYLVTNESDHVSMWEREPNRRLVLSTANPVNGVFDTGDVNFVSGMTFDAVPDNLFIGPYPQCPADIDAMKAAGVTAVLNVQSEEDVHNRKIPVGRLNDYYRQVGIQHCRHAIMDFCPNSLRERLLSAVRTLDSLIRNGHKVYIHCTAGMGRAPAVAVAYLSWVRGMSPEAANSHVRHYRKVAFPNMGVIAPLVRSVQYRY